MIAYSEPYTSSAIYPVSPVEGSKWNEPTINRILRKISTRGSKRRRRNSPDVQPFDIINEEKPTPIEPRLPVTDSSTNTDPEPRASRSRAFKRVFIPGWSENVPEGEKWYQFIIKGMHTLFAVLIPVILLLPLVLLRRVRFKLDTDTGDYFAVSAIQAWVAPGGEG